MRLNDATPADWDRVRKQHPAIEIKTGLEAWMKAAHDEDADLWEDESLEDIIAREDEEEACLHQSHVKQKYLLVKHK